MVKVCGGTTVVDREWFLHVGDQAVVNRRRSAAAAVAVEHDAPDAIDQLCVTNGAVSSAFHADCFLCVTHPHVAQCLAGGGDPDGGVGVPVGIDGAGVARPDVGAELVSNRVIVGGCEDGGPIGRGFAGQSAGRFEISVRIGGILEHCPSFYRHRPVARHGVGEEVGGVSLKDFGRTYRSPDGCQIVDHQAGPPDNCLSHSFRGPIARTLGRHNRRSRWDCGITILTGLAN